MNRPKRRISQPPEAYYRRGNNPASQWETAPSRVYRVPVRRRPTRGRRSCLFSPGCLGLILLLGVLGGCLAAYTIFPGRTNVLLLGVDYVDPAIQDTVARTDTIILATFNPRESYIGMLSIPRDLWVTIPGFGENRINSAHFFAEGRERGSGPKTLMETIEMNFEVPVGYYLRLRFEGFREVVDALGGVDIELTEPMAGYPPGVHHLKARKALGFVRDRSHGDDFTRMKQGQVMVKAIYKTMLKPQNWPRLPQVATAGLETIDTNLPPWMWPRLALAVLWVGPDGIDSRYFTREMAVPYLTDQGAQVLLPNWGLIRPVVREIFRN